MGLFRLPAAVGALLVLVLGQPAPCRTPSSLPRSGPVDVTLCREVDFSGDGRQQLVKLRIRGKAWNRGFRWELRIEDGDRLVLRREGNDDRSDELFGQPDYVLGCRGYRDCKTKWYLHDFLPALTSTRPVSSDSMIYQMSSDNPVFMAAGPFLRKECQLDSARADGVMRRIVKRLQEGKAVILYVPETPVQSEMPLIYVPEVGRFVPVFQW
jgi:hypothetical protein